MVRPPRRSAARVASLAARLAPTVADESSDADSHAETGGVQETLDRVPLPGPRLEGLVQPLHRTRVRLVAGVECVAFWLAIVLPFLTLPLLASGIGTGSELIVFVSLLLGNVLALVVGKDHRRH